MHETLSQKRKEGRERGMEGGRKEERKGGKERKENPKRRERKIDKLENYNILVHWGDTSSVDNLKTDIDFSK